MPYLCTIDHNNDVNDRWSCILHLVGVCSSTLSQPRSHFNGVDQSHHFSHIYNIPRASYNIPLTCILCVYYNGIKVKENHHDFCVYLILTKKIMSWWWRWLTCRSSSPLPFSLPLPFYRSLDITPFLNRCCYYLLI